MEKQELQYEANVTVAKAVQYLTEITKGLEKSSLTLKQEDSELELTPTGQVQVEVSAKRKEDKQKITISLQWKTGTEEPAEPELSIVSS